MTYTGSSFYKDIVCSNNPSIVFMISFNFRMLHKFSIEFYVCNIEIIFLQIYLCLDRRKSADGWKRELQWL